MSRKRPESTIYLGETLMRKLQAYRRRFPVPPTISAVVREAVARYLDEEPHEAVLPPENWVLATDAEVNHLRERGIRIGTRDILEALDMVREERVDDLEVDGAVDRNEQGN